MLDAYVYKDKKKLRCGYTTGSCAAAAAQAASELLLFGEAPEEIKLLTPGGMVAAIPIEEAHRTREGAACAARKDAGDDTDVTDGMQIFAEAILQDKPGVLVTGGPGIGKVTQKGLEQPVGEYAINSVPRKMICEAVEAVLDKAAYEGGILVRIFAPQGETLAAKTFNPALGIVGGISILGTSGIVEPMSEKALLDTISLEIRMHREKGEQCCIITPGNYGMHFIAKELNLDLKHTVKCSNFIGDTIDMAGSDGMSKLLLVGHLGKLVKLGAGIMNTHSRWGDARMEILCACALEAGGECGLLHQILGCVTTDEAVALLKENELADITMQLLLKKIEKHLKKRALDSMQVEAVVFSNRHGLLGMTQGAQAMMGRIRKEEER